MHSRLFAFFLIWTMLLAPVPSVQAAPIKQPDLSPAFSDGYALVDAVNQLRAANGLPAYQINIALTISAQLHSEYQASIGTWAHDGSGGTDEAQRAATQGYGSGGSFMCDEAVGFGYQYTAQKMVEMWNEPTHAPIMLSSRYIDVGGGAAIDADGRIFYTLDVCFISGQSAVVSGTGADNIQSTLEPFSGIQTATPQPDGSIIHEVQAGESLFSVADLYEMTLDELLTMNNLTKDSLIFPGDLLKVREALPPTPSPEPSLTPTPVIPTATRRPTRTPTTLPMPSATLQPTAAPTPDSLLEMPDTAAFMDRGLPAIAASLAATGVVMILVGSLLKRRRR